MMSQWNHSYMPIYNRMGYNETYGFTYFSEFNRLQNGLQYAEAFFLISIFLFSLTENGLLLVVVFTSPKLRNASNAFEGNMALSSLLFILVAPMIAVGRVTESWLLGDLACKFSMLMLPVTSVVLIWSMVLVSIDRYRKVMTPGRQQLHRTHVIISVAAIWLISMVNIAHGIYSQVITIEVNNRTISYCTLIFPKSDGLTVNTFLFAYWIGTTVVIPISIILHNYIKILHKLHTVKMKLEGFSTPLNNSTIGRKHQQTILARRNKKHRRIVITLLCIMVLFILMWSPAFIAVVLIQYNSVTHQQKMLSRVFVGSLITCFLNTCVNPFLYGYNDDKINRTMKRHIVRFCSCIEKRRTPVNRAGSAARQSMLDSEVLTELQSSAVDWIILLPFT